MKYSIDLMDGKKYKIPEIINDSQKIKAFLSENYEKKIVVVQGLGFVGAVMALVCANAMKEDYAVIGVDLASEEAFWKIESINKGTFPMKAEDPKIDEFFNNAKINKNFLATADKLAYKYADIIIVDINLDVVKQSNPNGELNGFDVDLKGFKSAIRSIGSYCKEDVLILIETTVPPGTCDKIVKPIIDEELEKRKLSKKNYKLGHSYERVMPGPDYISSIRSYPRVYSGYNLSSADAIEEFLKTIIDVSDNKLTRLPHMTATEMCKVLENSYRAMNISFMIEWSRFAEEAGVDLYSMVNAIRVRKTHANLMFPGIGVGGYCLTKDPLLASWGRKTFFNSNDELKMSINSVSLNDQMPLFAFQRLSEKFDSFYHKNILILGITYRGDVGDTRYSPVEKFFDFIDNCEANIFLHDPYISYWKEKNQVVENNIENILNNKLDIIIISAGHSIYKETKMIMKLYDMQPTTIYDTIGLLNEQQIFLLKEKHCVLVLGRGDLY